MFTKEILISIVAWVTAIILMLIYSTAGYVAVFILWIYYIYFMSINTPSNEQSLGIKICWFLGILGLLIWTVITKPATTNWTD